MAALLPSLLFLIGPPAVGKMTVGREVEARTSLRLFHNHQAIELALRYFPFGSPPFSRIVGELRRRIFDEIAASDLGGLVFTYVWAFDDPRDDQTIADYAAPFRARGGRVMFVELQATQEERLRRNETELRLAEKPSKRDVPASRARLVRDDERYQLDSRGRFAHDPAWLHLDTTTLDPATTAAQIVRHFAL